MRRGQLPRRDAVIGKVGCFNAAGYRDGAGSLQHIGRQLLQHVSGVGGLQAMSGRGCRCRKVML